MQLKTERASTMRSDKDPLQIHREVIQLESQILRKAILEKHGLHEYDGLMGIGPVGSSSDEEDNSELTDLEIRSRIEK